MADKSREEFDAKMAKHALKARIAGIAAFILFTIAIVGTLVNVLIYTPEVEVVVKMMMLLMFTLNMLWWMAWEGQRLLVRTSRIWIDYWQKDSERLTKEKKELNDVLDRATGGKANGG